LINLRMIYKYKTEKYSFIINCLLIFGTIGLLKKKKKIGADLIWRKGREKLNLVRI